MPDTDKREEKKGLAFSSQSLAQDSGAGCSDNLAGVWKCAVWLGHAAGAKGKCQLFIPKVKYFGSQISHFRAAFALNSKTALTHLSVLRLWEDPSSY